MLSGDELSTTVLYGGGFRQINFPFAGANSHIKYWISNIDGDDSSLYSPFILHSIWTPAATCNILCVCFYEGVFCVPDM